MNQSFRKGFEYASCKPKRADDVRVPAADHCPPLCNLSAAPHIALQMKLPDALLFASDAEILAFVGVMLLVLAGFASLMERRRIKRAALNQVGWMPWTGIFLTLAIIGGGLLSVAVPAILTA